MPNDYCGLTPTQLEQVKTRHQHYIPVRVDNKTTIFIDPTRDIEEAKQRFIKNVEYFRRKHIGDER